MKIHLVYEKELQSIIRQYNPLLIRSDEGLLNVYNTYTDCYFDFLNNLAVKYRKGYCDVILLFVDCFRMSLNVAESVFNGMQKKYRYLRDPLIVDWSDRNECMKFCSILIQCVSDLTDSPFSNICFDMAFEKFYSRFKFDK